MSVYYKPMTCRHCGFVENVRMNVHGDFDGWDPADLVNLHRNCPFCKHARKLKLVVPAAPKSPLRKKAKKRRARNARIKLSAAG